MKQSWIAGFVVISVVGFGVIAAALGCALTRLFSPKTCFK
jgi:hypothetical protein